MVSVFFKAGKLVAQLSSPDLNPSPVVNSNYNSDQGDEGADVNDDF